MSRLPRRDVSVRTPSSAMLVQMLFVIGALGTGAVSALVSYLGPRREKQEPSEPEVPPAPEGFDE